MSKTKKKIIISDVTLRDGNHAVEHSINENVIRNYCEMINEAGIDVVEVGHGNGLGASSLSIGRSAISDEKALKTARSKLKKAKLPYIVLLANPTTGGVTASFAMLGDIHIAEPGATIGFAGKRVIEETVKEKLPENFQTSAELMRTGFLDAEFHRKEINDKIISQIKLNIPTYKKENLPKELISIDPVKPGSRNL